MEIFKNLKKPVLLEDDYQESIKRQKEQYLEKTNHYPKANDRETFLIEQNAYERSLLINQMNFEAQQNLLAFAKGKRLDDKGALVGCKRLEASKAQTIIKVIFNEHQSFVLPKGFSVMAVDDKSEFLTLEDVIISKDEEFRNITCQCSYTGNDGNNFLKGQINKIVEPNQNIKSAENITVSAGGSDKEDDLSFKRRIFLSPSQFSVAGPYDAYEFHARSAHQSIVDVNISSPLPNDIVICSLLKGGNIPTKTINDLVLKACSEKTKRPLGDRVSTINPKAISKDITINLKIYHDLQTMIDETIDQINEQVDKTINKWRNQLGHDLVPDALLAIAQNMQAVYLATTKSRVTKISNQEFADIQNVFLTYELTDEKYY